MLEIGKKLFAKIHRRKKHANHNHDVHFMARDIDEWLPEGIQTMIDGTYDPRCLKRHYFPDEVIDQLHLSDRIFQHILLKQLKPTFNHVMNHNCYHLDRCLQVLSTRPNESGKYWGKKNPNTFCVLISNLFMLLSRTINWCRISKNIITTRE